MSVGPVREFDLDRFMADDYPDVVAAVRLVTGERGAAEDAVQDVLVGLLSRPPAEPLRSLRAWVTVAACNRARSGHRRRDAESRAMQRWWSRSAPAAVSTAASDLDGDTAEVIAALRSLPDRQRQVCVLHYFLDASVAEVAEALGVTDGTVKTLLHRARTALAGELGDDPRATAQEGSDG